MINIRKLEDSIKEHLGDITDEQRKIILSAVENPFSEKELYEKLGGR